MESGTGTVSLPVPMTFRIREKVGAEAAHELRKVGAGRGTSVFMRFL
jgi:hypothetical protein